VAISVAVDNSVLSDLVDARLPKNKKVDYLAFRDIIELDHQGKIEILIPITTTLIEHGYASGEKKQRLREIMGDAFRLCPGVVPEKMQSDIKQKKKCLREIMQDRGGIDSENLVVSTIYTPYYITTDYRYWRQFKARSREIQEKCHMNVFVLRPSEFLEQYRKGEL